MKDKKCSEREETMRGNLMNLMRWMRASYSEKAYCMKFMRPLINFDSIKVTLNIKKTNGDKIQNGYELAEKGFDNINMEEVFKICPELKNHTGELIHEKLKLK